MNAEISFEEAVGRHIKQARTALRKELAERINNLKRDEAENYKLTGTTRENFIAGHNFGVNETIKNVLNLLTEEKP